MTWLDAFNAAMKRRSRFDCQDDTQSCQPESAGDCPTAKPTKLTPLPDVTQLIHRRALVQSNRNRDQAARYLRKHLILAKGSCYDAG